VARCGGDGAIQFPKSSIKRMSEMSPFVDETDDGAPVVTSGGRPPAHVILKKSIMALHQFFDGADAACRRHGGPSTDPLIRQWRLFVDGTYIPDDLIRSGGPGAKYLEGGADASADAAACVGAGAAARTSAQDAAALGQYFASAENATAVVRGAIRQLRVPPSPPAANDGSSRTLPVAELHCRCGKRRRIIFVEPSCGDGRILSKILAAVAAAPQLCGLDGSPAVFACDIDPNAVEVCRVKFPDVAVRCGNFLHLSREEITKSVLGSERGDTASVDDDGSDDDNHLIFIGGPPYTVGRGGDIDRDLPMQFVRHCILELGGEVVAFILPQRCRGDAANLLQQLEDGGCGVGLKGTKWNYINEELDNIFFEFRGRRVKQPSILQIWYKD